MSLLYFCCVWFSGRIWRYRCHHPGTNIFSLIPAVTVPDFSLASSLVFTTTAGVMCHHFWLLRVYSKVFPFPFFDFFHPSYPPLLWAFGLGDLTSSSFKSSPLSYFNFNLFGLHRLWPSSTLVFINPSGLHQPFWSSSSLVFINLWSITSSPLVNLLHDLGIWHHYFTSYLCQVP
jgi:hypothetical protein